MRLLPLILTGFLAAACGGTGAVDASILKSGYGPRCATAAECPSTGVCRGGRCAPHWEGLEGESGGGPNGVSASCGNGILERGESCDDGNLIEEDDCLTDCSLPRCGDGFVQTGEEDCDDGTERCGEDCHWASDGSTEERGAFSCLKLHQLHPELPSGQYWIQPAERAWRVHCDMDFDGGGWTRVARVASEASLWNAWLDSQEGEESYGIPISSLSNCCDGEELSYAFKVDGELQAQRYQSVLGIAFDASQEAGNFDENGVLISPAVGEEYAHCAAILTRQNSRWNWSIAQQRFDGCSGFQADGFLLAGRTGMNEQAARLFGLGRYTGEAFASLEVLVREAEE